jgi:hypothetical protein
MKIGLVMISLFWAFVMGCTQGKQSLAEPPKRQGYDGVLYGDVESLVRCGYYASGDIDEWELGSEFTCQEYFFNERGDVERRAEHWSCGMVADYAEFIYDNGGRLTEEVWRGADGEVFNGYIYIYDEQGRVVELQDYDAGDRVATHCKTFLYDADGRQTQITDYDLAGQGRTLVESHQFTYDSQGHLKSMGRYNESFDVEWYESYTYLFDESGRIAEKTDYTLSGEVIWKTIFNYDSDGRMTSWVVVDDDKVNESHYLSYDIHGNLIRELVCEGNKEWVERCYEYRITYR